MPVSRFLSAAVALGLMGVPVLTVQALAVDASHLVCLSKAEQRAAVAANQAIPLAQVIKTLRQHGHRAELVRARLCRHDETVVYVLTLLARSGKVTRATVDAGNGELVNGH
jgi:uncharacterized membrane protein YkoI